MMPNNEVPFADLYCGGGGFTLGAKIACARKKRRLTGIAINHWDIAIDTHSANHADIAHKQADLATLNPLKVVPSGYLRILLAAPECTNHSNAKGDKPREEQSRAQPMLILDWLSKLYVEDVIIEKVTESMKWGPLDQNLKPIKRLEGTMFFSFLHMLEALGYQYVEHRILTAADYGDPTSRDRLFIIARKSKPIHWPKPTHHPDPEKFIEGNNLPLFTLQADSLQRWRPAREIIDWSKPGRSIFHRKKPLVDNTLRRIAKGLQQICGINVSFEQLKAACNGEYIEPVEMKAFAQPFIAAMNHGKDDSRVYSIDRPLFTVTQVDATAIVQPFIVESYRTGGARDVEQPLTTVVAGGNHHGLVQAFLSVYHGASYEGGDRISSIDNPLPTVGTSNQYGLTSMVVPYYGTGVASSVEEPLPTVTANDRFGLTVILHNKEVVLDILYRMLEPHELQRAHSFGADYKFAGNRKEKVKQIGNSVPALLAAALVESVLDD